MPARRQRLPLTALRTFESAARLLSFKDAADELFVSPTTVSNQIRQLERDWRCQLFVRKARQVILTDTGRSLSHVVNQAFEAIRTEIEGHLTVSRKPVTLAVGPMFGSRWLIPRLTRFRQMNPQVELILRHTPRITSAHSMTTDIAVDWGQGSWAGLDAQRLLDIRYAPVLSPTLARENGGITELADLARFPILHQHDRTEWNAWLKLASVSELVLAEGIVIEDTSFVTQAAIDGQGVALGNFPLIQREVDAGLLIRPFEIELFPTRSFFALTRPGARDNEVIAAVFDWLTEEALTPS